MKKKLISAVGVVALTALLAGPATTQPIQNPTLNTNGNGLNGAPVNGQLVQPVNQVRELAPGVLYELLVDKRNLAGEELRVHILKADMNNPEVDLQIVNGGKNIGDTATVQQMAERHGAVGAINGGFYANVGNRRLPVGNLMMDGQLQSISDFTRSSFGIRNREDNGKLHKEVVMGYFNPQVAAYMPGGRVEIAGINTSISKDGTYMFTSQWGQQVTVDSDVLVISMEKIWQDQYRVLEISQGVGAIPPAGIALALKGESKSLISGLTTNLVIQIDNQWDRQYWGDLKQLMTSGPLLVEQGQPVFQAVQEGFTGSVLEPNPRSALGVTKDNQLLLVVGERAQNSSGRIGLTLEEMALLMVELGAEQAIGLDSGGSSTLWAGKEIVNNTRNNQRAVANGLVITVGPKLFVNGQRVFPDVPPVVTSSRTLVPIRVIMENLGAKVSWNGATQQVTIAQGEREIVLTIGHQVALVDGQEVAMDVPAQIQQERTMIPVRFVTEALQGQVHWDGKERSIYITTDKVVN